MPSKKYHPKGPESDQAAEAYRVYESLAPSIRSLRLCAQALGRTPSYINQLKIWSATYFWQERVKAHDEQVYADEKVRRAALRDQVVESDLTMAAALEGKWWELYERAPLHERTVEKIFIDEETNGKTVIVRVELKPGDWLTLTRLAREISAIKRLALGMPEKITNPQLTGDEGKPLFDWKKFVEEALNEHEHGSPISSNGIHA